MDIHILIIFIVLAVVIATIVAVNLLANCLGKIQMNKILKSLDKTAEELDDLSDED